MSRKMMARLTVVQSESRKDSLSLRGYLGTSAQAAVTVSGFAPGDQAVLLPAGVVFDVNDAVYRLQQWLGTSHDEDELIKLLTHLTAVSEPLR
jgi:hypothetical protein